MRTTITLDPDVAAEIERRRRETGTSFKEEVNRLLRAGLLRDAEDERRRGEPFRLTTFSVGRSLVDGLDDVADALARAEGEGFR